MFEQTFTTDTHTKRERTIAFALLLQAAGVAALTLLPLVTVGSIEMEKRLILLPPRAIRKEVAVVERNSGRTAGRSIIRVAQLETLSRPQAYSIRIQPLIPGDAPALPGSSGGETAFGGGIPDGLANSSLVVALPPPLASKPPQRPLRVPSNISQSQLIFGPKPVYPRLAVSARIAGTVRLQATISREGHIENLRVLSGHPMLTGPALEAVRAWRYRPLLLNGDPVEVITEIDVNFTLQP